MPTSKRRNKNRIKNSNYPKKRISRPDSSGRPVRKSVNSNVKKISRAKPRVKPVKPPVPPPPVTKPRADVFLRILAYMLVPALAYYLVCNNVFHLKNVEVKGNTQLSADEVIQLASLSDSGDVWTFFIGRERICQALENHPLINYAEVSKTGINSIMIKITERQAAGALEKNGSHMIFDHTGELLAILPPGLNPGLPVVTGMYPGLLRIHGISIRAQSEAWVIPAVSQGEGYPLVEPQELDTQFDRLIHLISFLRDYTPEYMETLDSIRMNETGRLSLMYHDLPPIQLGRFNKPEEQFRRVASVLDAFKNDPDSWQVSIDDILYVNLASTDFPFIRVSDENYSYREIRGIESAEQVLLSEVKEEDPAEQNTNAAQDEKRPDFDSGFFSLTGRDSHDD